MIKKKIHGCLYIWNISSLVQLDISPVSAIELNSRREIPYLRAPVDYSLFLLHFNLICNNICNRTARKAQFYWIISIVNCAIFFTSNDSNGRENTFKHIWWVISESILLATCFLLPFNRILCPEEKTFKCKKWITDAKRFEPLLALLYMDHNFKISF